MRPLRAATSAGIAVPLLIALLLTGCATPAAGTGVTDAAEPDAIAARAGALGIAPDLVYTTEVDGYVLAPQSVGANGVEGMSASWTADGSGGILMLRTDRGELTAETCAAMPLWDAADAPVTCTEEDGVWHRSGGGIDEYATSSEGAVIRVIGMDGVPAEDLAAAAQAVHVPSEAELELLFSDAPTGPATPVERGDIPENGDGAPVDPVGPGG
ncbi:hypothetical protein [Microbacterium kyungheense]|uniref:Uncharacterized protein n=1 Tax=Microbacterium kyungheense TaxID=1263636 RepID=A0A543EU23_9MICO|nr:hypothetical protein [Microbacterium kyungheense]TQM25059.1 hypothetical protein FB391_2518 [Microbacterium kyungheense]